MAVVVLLRGVNVGGHRTFRPSVVATRLSRYDVVNVGAAGTFVVRKAGSRAELRGAVLGKLPFPAQVVICAGRDLIRLADENPFGADPTPPDIVRFVSFLASSCRVRIPMPMTLSADGEWSLRIMGATNRFVFGEYRRHMPAIRCLGQLDKLFGVPTTTRSWTTVMAVVRILKDDFRTRR